MAKLARYTDRARFTCVGVPHLSNADALRDEGKPFDDEATTQEVYRIAAMIRARNMELVRRGKFRAVREDEDWTEPG